ncbi:hypothetical protein [Pseudonocardia zijingensis]|uniref:Small secreted domain DUF320 n=1 Tax=Pseudonocardia zijingensis TaxID=153376 RepID=A0ABP4AMA1_9PSEU
MLGIAVAMIIGLGFAASVGLAHAGDEPGSVGAPGDDGEDVTCTSHYLRPANAPLCNAVGGDGEDGATGARR